MLLNFYLVGIYHLEGIEFAFFDFLQDGVVLLDDDTFDFAGEIRAVQERGIKSFPRGENLAGFVDGRFHIVGWSPSILCLDVEIDTASGNGCVVSCHSLFIILPLKRISSE
jgi:hypothetical protein